MHTNGHLLPIIFVVLHSMKVVYGQSPCTPGAIEITCSKSFCDCIAIIGGPCTLGDCIDISGPAGDCSIPVFLPNCFCADGFTGMQCDINIDDCEPNPCLNGAACNDGISAFECQCVDGFEGTLCENNIDDCETNPCQNGGTCNDGINGFTCSCAAGFEGPTCQVNSDDCASIPCRNGATCLDQINDFSCVCAPGFQGINCETNINDCLALPCQNGGVCIDLINNYVCDCPLGFGGRNCQVRSGCCFPCVLRQLFLRFILKISNILRLFPRFLLSSIRLTFFG